MTSRTETHKEIARIRQQMGERIIILGHHYQHESVIRHTDKRGDSLELARSIPSTQAENIVFCGVYFMAESAALLSRAGQKVYLPNLAANCVMSQMAPAALVDTVLQGLKASGRKVIPLAYVNSSVAVKAVCGAHGGSVCTSANAERMMQWALDTGDAVLFLPDKFLGANTANRLHLPKEARHILNIKNNGQDIDLAIANAAQLLLWPGCCAIHARFTPQRVHVIRGQYPGIKVIVHPECSPEVVAEADAAGSTSFIIKYVADAPDGSSIAIGTEYNLVQRLTNEYAGRRTIVPLLSSTCSHMARITEEKLLETLQAVVAVENKSQLGPALQQIVVAPAAIEHAKLSLTRMLEICR